jgi:NitT/TauT family transport system ATP-binding protein
MSKFKYEPEEVPPEKLALEHVKKSFKTRRGEVVAIEDVSISIAEGEFVCLVGPSGCGKSTILSLIAGLESPDEGQVTADGAPVTGSGRDRMVMFQDSALFPWLDVTGNVLFGLKLKPNLTAEARREVARYHLHMVGLDDFAHANVHELSGGMKQRVALARALAPNPRVLLMDEPFASLDAMTREQLYGDVQRIWSSRKKTIVFVTHDVREAVVLGDRVILMSPHPGRVKEEFRIDLPRPRDVYGPAVSETASRITESLRGYLEQPGTRAGATA